MEDLAHGAHASIAHHVSEAGSRRIVKVRGVIRRGGPKPGQIKGFHLEKVDRIDDFEFQPTATGFFECSCQCRERRFG